MRRASAGTWLATTTLLSSQLMVAAAIAQPAGDDLLKMQANPAYVVMPTITYDHQRHSGLKQITP